MLVMTGRSLSQPILGYNVIEQIVKTNITEQLEATREEQLHGWLRAPFPSLDKERYYSPRWPGDNWAVVWICCENHKRESHCAPTYLCSNWRYRHRHPRKTLSFSSESLEFCENLVHLRSGVSLYIILDVQNLNDHDIELSGRTVVAILQQTQDVYQATVLEKSDRPTQVSLNQVSEESEQVTDAPWNPPINLSHLSRPERAVAQDMLSCLCRSHYIKRWKTDMTVLHKPYCTGMAEEIQLILCLAGGLCKQKGWKPSTLYRLPRTKQKAPPWSPEFRTSTGSSGSCLPDA